MRVWSGFIWHRICSIFTVTVQTNEPSVSVKGGNIFEGLRDYKLLKKHFGINNIMC
jgi:hypothetical protein